MRAMMRGRRGGRAPELESDPGPEFGSAMVKAGVLLGPRVDSASWAAANREESSACSVING